MVLHSGDLSRQISTVIMEIVTPQKDSSWLGYWHAAPETQFLFFSRLAWEHSLQRHPGILFIQGQDQLGLKDQSIHLRQELLINIYMYMYMRSAHRIATSDNNI